MRDHMMRLRGLGRKHLAGEDWNLFLRELEDNPARQAKRHFHASGMDMEIGALVAFAEIDNLQHGQTVKAVGPQVQAPDLRRVAVDDRIVPKLHSRNLHCQAEITSPCSSAGCWRSKASKRRPAHR